MAGTGNYGGSLARSGSCTVYSNQLFGSVREDAMQESYMQQAASTRRGMGRSKSTPIMRGTDGRLMSQDDYMNKAKRHHAYKEEEFKSVAKIKIATKAKTGAEARRREANFVKSYNSLLEGQELGQKMYDIAAIGDAAEARKRQNEHTLWEKNVHGKIQAKIAEEMEKRPYHEMTMRKNHDMQEFLDATNKKGGLFRDIIIESEYDPLGPNRRAIKADTGYLVDPSIRVSQRRYEEHAMVDRRNAIEERDAATGRDSLPATLWGDLLIRSTPHGCFAKMMAKKDKVKTKMTASKDVIADDFNRAVGPEAVNAEFPLGKRCNIEPAEPDLRNSSLGNYYDDFVRVQHIIRH